MDLSIAALIRSIMTDVGCQQNDITYVLKRLDAEGVRFVTIELPKFSKAVISSLERGFFDRQSITSFRFKGSLTHFLENLLKEIFDNDGRILECPSGAAIRAIRQVCEYQYKLALPYSKELKDEAERAFIENEHQLQELGQDRNTALFSEQLRKDFETFYPEIARVHAHTILSSNRPRSTNGTFIDSDECYFIERESTQKRGYPTDCAAFSGYYKSYPGLRHGLHNHKSVCEGNWSELLLVPKDSRGPRTICREAIKRLETQMAYFDFMISGLTRLSEGAINFKNQEVNRLIAEESSVTKACATLDLKDASDRVSYSVIKTIFRNCPGLRWFITGSRRATRVKIGSENDLSSSGYRPLHKLAGMGSGLTFPTMSLLISLAICNRVRKRTGLEYEHIRKNVFIYGDDICVPRNWYAIAIEALAMIGLRVNVTKSFVRGNFRESCGADFFAGFDVTPVRLKLSNSKVKCTEPGRIKLANGANSFKQLYEHCKQLYKAGLHETCKYVMSVLDVYHRTTFGTAMPPGAFDDSSDLALNFVKGTDHYRIGDTVVAYTTAPVKIQVETKKVFGNGSVYERDPYKYLGTFLSVTKTNTDSDSSESLRRMNVNRMDPETPSRFAELTAPRNLTFLRKEVRVEYILKNFVPLSREQVLEDLSAGSFFTNYAYLSYASLFLKAYI